MTAHPNVALAPGDTILISAAALPPPPPPVVPPRTLGWWHSTQDVDIFSIEAGLGRQFDGGRTFDAYDRGSRAAGPQDIALANAGRARCSSLKLDMYDKIMADLKVPTSQICSWTKSQLALPGKAYLAIDHEADAKSAQAHAAGQKETFPTVHRAWVDWMANQPGFDPKRHIPMMIDTNYKFAERIAGCWPGAQYSPVIGVDVYETGSDPAVALKDCLAFAQAQGVHMAWPEWGYLETVVGLSKAALITEYASFAKSNPLIDWICWWSGTPGYSYTTSSASALAYKQTGLLLVT